MLFDPDKLLWLILVFSFLFGASMGSFLNVVIYRLPRKMSLVKPPSHCPSCETPIKAYDNVPVFGWLWLRGKCRVCKSPISIRYPAIEFLVGVLALLLAWKICGSRLEIIANGEGELMDLFVPWVLLFFFLAALVSLFFIDLDITELPPEITIPGMILGLIWAYAVPEVGLMADFTPNPTLADAAVGAVIGGGIILVLLLVYFMLTGRVGLGGGDIWMMAMCGAFFGWQGLFFIYLASSLQGIVVAVAASIIAPESSKLFRNEEVAELERELGLREPRSAPIEVQDPSDAGSGEDETGEARTDESAAGGAEPGEDEDGGIGKLAVPFGPFIAVSAVEYLFLGHILLPLMTGGALGPNGFFV